MPQATVSCCCLLANAWGVRMQLWVGWAFTPTQLCYPDHARQSGDLPKKCCLPNHSHAWLCSCYDVAGWLAYPVVDYHVGDQQRHSALCCSHLAIRDISAGVHLPTHGPRAMACMCSCRTQERLQSQPQGCTEGSS